MPLWEKSDMADATDLRGRRLYDALMNLKPPTLLEGDWAKAAGLNRGFFTDLKKPTGGAPRSDTLRKLLSEVNATEEDLYRAADGTNRVPAGPMSKAPEQPRVHTVDAGETVGILSLDLSLSMGLGRDIEEFVESDVVGFDMSVLRRITRTPPDRLRFVTGIGTSHEPRFQSGDQFLIDINERHLTRIDGYYWITFEGSHGLKRLRPVSGGRVLVISDNKEDYPPFEVDARELRIEGRAIWFARGL